jgi:hypothetical protein
MLAHFASMARRSATVTAAAAVLMVAISAAFGGIGSYLFKMLVLVILFGEFQNSTAFSPVLFGLTALVLVAAYDGSLIVWWTRTKMLYVEPDGER